MSYSNFNQENEEIGYLTNKQKHISYVNIYKKYISDFQRQVKRKKFQKTKGNSRYVLSYFVIYTDFLKILASIPDGAVALYILIGLSVNQNGYCTNESSYYSNVLNRSTKTIKVWLKMLIEKKLIYQHKTNNEVFLFIYPYNSDIQYENTDDIKALSRKYRDWIKLRKKRGSKNKVINPFFPIPGTFVSSLKKLKHSALKLFIYCGLKMNLKEGYLTDTIEQISENLNWSKRKVSYGFQELKNMGLIDRQQLIVDSYSYTYILPFYINYEELAKIDYYKHIEKEEDDMEAYLSKI